MLPSKTPLTLSKIIITKWSGNGEEKPRQARGAAWAWAFFAGLGRRFKLDLAERLAGRWPKM